MSRCMYSDCDLSRFLLRPQIMLGALSILFCGQQSIERGLAQDFEGGAEGNEHRPRRKFMLLS